MMRSSSGAIESGASTVLGAAVKGGRSGERVVLPAVTAAPTTRGFPKVSNFVVRKTHLLKIHAGE